MMQNNHFFNLRWKIVFLFFLVFVIGILIGLRPIGADRDSKVYASKYNEVLTNSDQNFYTADPGFLIISNISNLFGFGFRGLLLFYSLFGLCLKIRCISTQSKYPVISFYLYFCIFLFLHEFSQIRVAISAGFFLLALPDLFERRYLQYLIKCVFACVFHYVAFIMFFFLIFNRNKLKVYWYYCLPLFLFILSLSNISIYKIFEVFVKILPSFLSYKVNLYLLLLKDGVYADINVLNVFYSSVLLIYYILLFNQHRLQSEYDRFLLKFLFYGLCFFYFFSFLPVFAFRISEFLFLILIILIPNAVKIFKEKRIVTLFIVFYFSAYWLYLFLQLVR